jgi:hypothetical protein
VVRYRFRPRCFRHGGKLNGSQVLTFGGLVLELAVMSNDIQVF